MMALRTRTLAGVLTLATSACGGGEKPAVSSIEKALSYESEERSAAEAASKVKTEELAKAAAVEKAATAQLDAEVAKVVVLPAKLPKNLKAACDGTVDAYEQFMRDNRDAGMVMPWFDNKSKNLGRQRQVCAQGTIKAAACLTHALTNAPDPLYDMGGVAVKRLQVACADQFGTGK
jgi:hypothetical protein